MRTELKRLRFLGLTSRDKRILEALPQKKAVSTSELSRLTHLPRSTTHVTIEKLHSRGFVRKVSLYGATHWKRVASTALHKQLSACSTFLDAYGTRSEVEKVESVQISKTMNIRLVHGALEIVKIYAHAYAGQPDERVLLTQLALGFRTFRSKTPIEKIKKINDVGALHKGILEMIVTEDTREEYLRLAQSDRGWTHNAKQRVVDISIVPNSYFPDQKSELFIFRNTVMLTDWHEEMAVLIESAELSRMLSSFFRIVKNQGESFDNHSFLNMLSTIVSKTLQ